MMTVFKDQVTINGLVFNNNTPDGDGNRYFLDSLDGWEDTADPQIQATGYGYSDGMEVASRAPLDAKHVEVGGWVTGTSRAGLEQARITMKRALKADDELLVVRNSPIPVQAIVRRETRIQYPQDFSVGADVPVYRYAFTVMQPWPFKVATSPFVGSAAPYAGGEYYRTYTTSAGPTYWRLYPRDYLLENPDAGSARPQLVVFVNDGDSNAYPVIDVQGPLLAGTWYLLHEESGEQLGFDADISTGQTLTIDMLNKTAYLGTIAVDYFLDGDWLKAYPGSNTYRLVSGTSDDTAGFTLTASSTWE